jgi:hypothetical protein
VPRRAIRIVPPPVLPRVLGQEPASGIADDPVTEGRGAAVLNQNVLTTEIHSSILQVNGGVIANGQRITMTLGDRTEAKQDADNEGQKAGNTNSGNLPTNINGNEGISIAENGKNMPASRCSMKRTCTG